MIKWEAVGRGVPFYFVLLFIPVFWLVRKLRKAFVVDFFSLTWIGYLVLLLLVSCCFVCCFGQALS